tara:strand:- start:6990 stop:7181 length:192 start_codon:yes stop_codon:yes gene_type:complete
MTREEITQKTIDTLIEAQDLFRILDKKPELDDYCFEGWIKYSQDLIQSIEMMRYEQDMQRIKQ